MDLPLFFPSFDQRMLIILQAEKAMAEEADKRDLKRIERCITGKESVVPAKS